MNSLCNMSGGFCSVQENIMEVEQQQQVWPFAVQNQNVAITTSDVASQHDNNFHVQESMLPNPFREGATDADWDAFLDGLARPVQDASIALASQPSTSSMEPEVGKIRPPKKHYAHITFVPSAGGLKPVVTRKRRRTAFTTEQVAALEEVFKHKPYVTREERSVLVQRLAVGDQAIKVWFQNRRLKQKKEIEEELEARIFPEHNMFAHTEFLLHQVDKNGCVALNDRSVHELVSAIDAFLPKDLDLSKLVSDSERSVETEESSNSSDGIHEPISPPEVGSSELCCAPDWLDGVVIDPKQSLQHLLDLHRSL